MAPQVEFKMKKLLFTICTFCTICTVVSAAEFDNRGIWHAIDDTDSLAHGVRTSSGIIDVSDREDELNVIVTGATPNDDSLVVTLEIYGLATPNLADTSNAVLIHNTSINEDGGGYAFADTLSGDEMYPYLWIKLTNDDSDESFLPDVYLYMKQKEITILQRR